MTVTTKSSFPDGWDEERVAALIDHYELQSEDEAVAEDQAARGDPGQTVMVIPTRLVPAVRELLAGNSDYASALCAAAREYRFPPVTFDFEAGEQIRHADMRGAEDRIRRLLMARSRQQVRDGLANVLYWGYANSPGRRDYRVEEFQRDVTGDQLDRFAEIAARTPPPGPARIKKIGLPQFSGMSFITKIMMFLDPAGCPVLDMKIAEAFSQSSGFPPLEGLVFRKRSRFRGRSDTTIRVTKMNECVYSKWASWCGSIAEYVNASGSSCEGLRAVDVERALFALADSDRGAEAWSLLRGPRGWPFGQECAP